MNYSEGGRIEVAETAVKVKKCVFKLSEWTKTTLTGPPGGP
jgi:hypothetical protein